VPSKIFFFKQYHKSPTFYLLLITTIISFFFFLWGVNSWKFAFAGDEWPFYIFAKKLASLDIYPDIFSFSGVYSAHSVLSSFYQSLFLKILGPSNFAWRLSNIILIFPITFFFYRWVKDCFSKEIAILSTIILQSSFYLANFFKIGYDNPQGFTLFIICLYLSNRFGQQVTKRLAARLGLAFGISFYLYMGAVFPLFVWPYFLPILKRTFLKNRTLIAISIVIAVYFIVLFPFFTDLKSLLPVVHALGFPDSFHLKQTVIKDFLLFYKNNDYFYNHFVTGPYLDVISRIFCLIGTAVVLFRSRQKVYLYFILSYITTTIFIGSTSSDWFSPTTRGIFLLPYGFVFAGIGLNFIVKKIKNESLSFILCWYVIFTIFAVNVYQSQIGVFSNTIYHKSGYTGMSFLINAMMQAKVVHTHVLIVLSPYQSINNYLWQFPAMLGAYNLDEVTYKIITPNNFQCPVINTDVVLFKQDIFAEQKVADMRCFPKSTVHYSVLSPSITVY